MTPCRLLRATLLSALVLSVSACGYNRGDRAASGALIGAGAGAALTAATGGAPLIGAAVGGAIGAAGGALTSSHDVNLGPAIWR